MNANLKPAFRDFRVADLALADWGRKEMTIAEGEMPGLMAIRREFAKTQPLKDARISGTFEAGKNDLFAEGLQTFFRLDVVRASDNRIVLKSMPE